MRDIHRLQINQITSMSKHQAHARARVCVSQSIVCVSQSMAQHWSHVYLDRALNHSSQAATLCPVDFRLLHQWYARSIHHCDAIEVIQGELVGGICGPRAKRRDTEIDLMRQRPMIDIIM
jgi:hypothetical protein